MAVHALGGEKHRHVLLMRFGLLNAAGFAFVLAAYLQGWLNGLLAPSVRVAAVIIVLVFLYGLLICAIKIWQTTSALNDIRSGTYGTASRTQSYLETTDFFNAENRLVQINLLRLRLSHKIAIVKQIANILVFLGLIGTVVGFIIALSGIDAKSATDTSNVAGMIGTLISGMSIALYTTLLGAVLNLWLTVNYRLLATGTVNLLGAIVELGESKRHG